MKPDPEPAVENVIFDIGGVILHVDFDPAVKAFSQECGLSPAEVMQGVMGSEELEAYDRGRITSRQFYATLQRKLGIRMDEKRIRRHWCDIFRENAPVADLIRSWSGRVPMFLISNTCRSHVEQFESQFDLFSHFRDRVYSCDVGLMKPEREIYDLAVNRFGVEASKSLFIDDRVENIHGARAAGLQAMHFQGNENFFADLSSLGLA